MLKSFVAPEDYSKLIALMLMVKDNILIDEYSTVVFYGSGNNGKTVMTKILEKIAPTTNRVSAHLFKRRHTGVDVSYTLAKINASLVVVGEPDYEHGCTLIDDIHYLIHYLRRQCNGQSIRPKLHSSETVVLKPGVFLITMNTKPIYTARRVLEIKFPNVFKYNEHKDDEMIVDQCVKEFYQMNFNTPNLQNDPFIIPTEQYQPSGTSNVIYPWTDACNLALLDKMDDNDPKKIAFYKKYGDKMEFTTGFIPHEEITDRERKLRNLYTEAHSLKPSNERSDPYCSTIWNPEDVYKIIIYPKAYKAARDGADYSSILTEHGIDELIANYFEAINKICKKDGIRLEQYAGLTRSYEPYIYIVRLEFAK